MCLEGVFATFGGTPLKRERVDIKAITAHTRKKLYV
jgi:hypothetical protein